MLHCSKIGLIIPTQTLANSLALCAALTSFESVELLIVAPVCGGAFTLTYHFRVNSNCLKIAY